MEIGHNVHTCIHIYIHTYKYLTTYKLRGVHHYSELKPAVMSGSQSESVGRKKVGRLGTKDKHTLQKLSTNAREPIHWQ